MFFVRSYWLLMFGTSIYLLVSLGFPRGLFAAFINLVVWLACVSFVGRRRLNKNTRQVILQLWDEFHFLVQEIERRPDAITLFTFNHLFLTTLIKKKIEREMVAVYGHRNLDLNQSEVEMLRTHLDAIFTVTAIMAYVGAGAKGATYRALYDSFFSTFLSRGDETMTSERPHDSERRLIFRHFFLRGHRKFKWVAPNQPQVIKQLQREISEIVDQNISIFLLATVGMNYKGATTFQSAQGKLTVADLIVGYKLEEPTSKYNP